MDTISLYHSELHTGDYIPRVVRYYFKQNRSVTAFHSHNEIEIMYVVDGKGVVEIEDEMILLKKGEFILIDANIMHRLVVEDHALCRMLNIEFTFTGSDGYVPSIKKLAEHNQEVAALLAKHMPYMTLRDSNEIYHTLKSLVVELDRKASDHQLMVQLLLSELLIRIARQAMQECIGLPQKAEMYVKRAVEYIHHHYDCHIQIKDIAATVNVHPGYLHRIFKLSMECTVMDYLTSIRIERAKMLLIQTDIPLIDICGHIGINNQQYFSSIFKKYTGKTPFTFRKSVEARWNSG